jgi:hypothetical protein
MLALVGYESVPGDMRPAQGLNARRRAMRDGLHSLKRATGADFGYDAAAWREYLIQQGQEFGYTHPYAYRAVDNAVQRSLADPDVMAVLSSLADGDG